MRRISWLLVTVMAVPVGAGCASIDQTTKQRQASSLLNFLYPETSQSAPVSEGVAEIKVPVRVGIAFVPDDTDSASRLPESNRLMLSAKVRDAFVRYPFIAEIVPVPSTYLERNGGFANLDRIAALLNLDVVALLSFEQVQNSGANRGSLLYWTGVGAYLIEGDKYDILTAVDTSVFHVKSRRLLFRAAGLSNIKGSATMVSFSEEARAARAKGFDEAVADMIAKLQIEVQAFREQASKNTAVRITLPPGYNSNAVRNVRP